MITKYWITGNYYDSRKKWLEIVATVKNPNVEVIECGSKDNHGFGYAQAADIISALKQKDIFDKRSRIIKVKGLPENYDALTDYLCLSSPTSLLVFDGPIGYKKPNSNRLNSVKTTKFFKQFQKEDGEVHEFAEGAKNTATAIDWVQKVATDMGKSIERDVASLLVQFKGTNYDTLYSDILKLSDFQSGKKITIDSVKECSIPLFQRQVWDLIDDMCRRDADSALTHLQCFYETAGQEPGTSFYGDVEMLLGAIAKQFLFFIMVIDTCGPNLVYSKIKSVTEKFMRKPKKGEKPDDEESKKWTDPLFDGSYVSFNLNKETTRLVSQWRWTQVYLALREIYRTRLAIRSNASASDLNRGSNKLMIDSLIMHICGKLTAKQVETMRGQK